MFFYLLLVIPASLLCMNQTLDVKIVYDQLRHELAKKTKGNDQDIVTTFMRFSVLLQCDCLWLNTQQDVKLSCVLEGVAHALYGVRSREHSGVRKLNAISWAKKMVKAGELGDLSWVKKLTGIDFDPEDMVPASDELQAKRLELLNEFKQDVYRNLQD